MQSDLNAIAVFVAVARARNFRAAGDQLGITRSAVSQAVRRLEDQLGTALLYRTTRSVALTEAGNAFLSRVAPALAELEGATLSAADRQARPSGTLRLAVSSVADSVLSGSMLVAFSEAYPNVSLDILVTDEEFDIVERGYDAAVRLGEVLQQDMIAVPVTGRQRQMVVAAPAYLDRNGAPAHPRDLPGHRCIGWRPAPNVLPYRWEFVEKDVEFDVAVDPFFTSNDMALMIRMACAGAGLTIGMAETFRPWTERGALVSVLDDYLPTFPGFYLFYSSRYNMAPKLRALVEHVQVWRGHRPSSGGSDKRARSPA